MGLFSAADEYLFGPVVSIHSSRKLCGGTVCVFMVIFKQQCGSVVQRNTINCQFDLCMRLVE